MKTISRNEVWVNGESRVEIYRSSYSSGHRGTGGRFSSFKIRGASLGVNNFGSREDARKFLAGRGYSPEAVS